MRLGNGFGSVYKLSGKRRCPYIAIITTGWSDDGKQQRTPLGYYKTKLEAITALSDYHKTPYNLEYNKLTFKDVWKHVEKDLEKKVNEGSTTNGNLINLVNAFENHLIELHNDKIMDIKYIKMQDMLDNAKKQDGTPLGRTSKNFMKTVCNYIFDYSIKFYELPIINNPANGLKVNAPDVSNKHISLTEEELTELWKHENDDIIKAFIIMCYMGTRPNELFTCKKENIFDGYIITGLKTEASKNRIIPIHPRIKHLIEYFNAKSNEYPFTTVIEDFKYSKYRNKFKKTIKTICSDHTPYDGRHTFASRMKKAGADEYILKRILGHTIRDITEKVYTHRDIEELKNEIKKIT